MSMGFLGKEEIGLFAFFIASDKEYVLDKEASSL